MTRLPILLAVAILAAACSSPDADSATTVTPPIDPDSVLVTVAQTGGCLMMGPNCRTYLVHANAEVTLHRTGDSGPSVDSAFIDPALTTDLAWLIATTDFAELRAGLAQGECQGCFDGIDTLFVFPTPTGDVTFDSVETVLDPSEPLFAVVWRIVDAANSSTDMPLVQR